MILQSTIHQPSNSLDRRTEVDDVQAAVASGGLVACPVCGQPINLANKEEALAHINKDEAHRKHSQEAQIADGMNRLVSTGLLRQVKHH